MINEEQTPQGFGLKPKTEDARDYKLGAVIPINEFPKLEYLPINFELDTSDQKDQGSSDFCTGYTTSLLIGTNEGVPIDANWMFAKSKELTGDIDEWGQGLRDALKVGVKFGALEIKDSPLYRVSPDSEENKLLRDIKNWPDTQKKEEKHKHKTFWEVTGPYSTFDNIRATMYWLY